VSTAAYYIGRHEVTYAEWIEFLDALSADERLQRSPRLGTLSNIALGELGHGHWRLTMAPSTQTYTADTGQRLHYEHRPGARRSGLDAVSGVRGVVRGRDRVRGLARSHRAHPGRAAVRRVRVGARSARRRWPDIPIGAKLAPDDANIDITYGRVPQAFGPDEVGSHPGCAARSAPTTWPATSGNGRARAESGDPAARGGSWYTNETSARSMNREFGEPSTPYSAIGVRLCATPR